MEQKNVYLDNAATTPLCKEAADAMYAVMTEHYGNPSSTHAHGRVVRSLIEDARKTVSKLMGCTPGEIFFTSGGTEADNMSIRKSVECLGVKNIITSPIEHHAVLHTVEELARAGKINMHMVKVDPKGYVDLADLERLLNELKNPLVTLMHSNNEIGTMIDIEKVGALCKEYNAYFHSDTVQTVGHYPFNLDKMNIHFLACAAHKFNGPKGIGFIYVKAGTKIDPYITGGSQERNMRGGTENVYGIVGLAKALEVATRDLEKDMEYIKGLKMYMYGQLKAHVPGIAFNGDPEGNSLYTVLSASFPPSPISEMMLFKLDIAGISVSGGSACSSGSNIGSHVLTALGVDPGRAAVRFSFGKQNTREEIDYAVARIVEMLKPKEAQAK